MKIDFSHYKKYHLSGKHKIEDLNKQYNFGLAESEEYDTLSGLIISHIGRIPKNKEIYLCLYPPRFKVVPREA